MSAIKRDSWITAGLCVILGLAIVIDTMTFPSTPGEGFGQGPGFYPQVLAWLVVIFGVLVPVMDTRRRGKDMPNQTRTQAPSVFAGWRWIVAVGPMLLVCILMTWAMPYCGFLPTGFLMTFCGVRLIRGSWRRGNWIRDLVFCTGMLALVYIMFQVFIGIQLPPPILLIG